MIVPFFYIVFHVFLIVFFFYNKLRIHDSKYHFIIFQTLILQN